jgi:SWI/SNF-related matrix-associated actin-dependent regulator 1 of chromatin subfamily A
MNKTVNIHKKRTNYYFEFSYDFDKNNPLCDKIKENIKKIPGRQFNWNTFKWEVPINTISIEYVEALSEYYGFIKTEDYNTFIDEYKLLMLENQVLSNAHVSELQIEDIKITPRPFQLAGIEYTIKNKRVILGDEQGLGKTIQAILTFHYLKSKRVTIICPSSLKYNWFYELLKCININENEIYVYNPNTVYDYIYDSTIISSKNGKETRLETILNNKKHSDYNIALEKFNEIKKNDNRQFEKRVFIINYNNIDKYKKELIERKCDFLIVDESHNIKNPKAIQSKAILEISKNIDYIMLLSGTPTLNKPIELSNQLKTIRRLKEFGGDWNFKMRYCDGKETYFGWDFSGASNISELHEKLRQICYIRRNKKEVLTELPDKQFSRVFLEIDNRKEYELAKNDLVTYLRQNKIKEDENYVISSLERFALEKMEELDMNNPLQNALVKMNILRQLTIKGKLNNAIEWIETFLESGEKLVVFTHHREPTLEIAKHFKCNAIIGGVDPEDRQKYVKDFQENPKTSVIVLNDAGSEGLTLTAACNMLMLELDWTPGRMSQKYDRVHRISQNRSVNIYHAIGIDTMDYEMMNLLETKREITEMINSGIEYKGDKINENQNTSVFMELLNKFILT